MKIHGFLVFTETSNLQFYIHPFPKVQSRLVAAEQGLARLPNLREQLETMGGQISRLRSLESDMEGLASVGKAHMGIWQQFHQL